jgi:hypothetical protein
MPYTTKSLVISTKLAPRRPVSVYPKFQCWFTQVWHKNWLHIVARNCALPSPWHTHTHTQTHTQTAWQKTALKLAWWHQRVETHTRSLWDVYLPFTWRASPQCCQIVRYAGSLNALFRDYVLEAWWTPRPVWTDAGNLTPSWIQSPDRPSRPTKT